MIIAQADPGWDLTDATRAPLRDPKTLAETDGQPDGFQDFLIALRDEVIAFRKPVAYVHGDSHYFRIDKPFLDALGPPARELHARRDVRRQPGERQQRRALAEGARRSAQPRGVRATSRRSFRQIAPPFRRPEVRALLQFFRGSASIRSARARCRLWKPGPPPR